WGATTARATTPSGPSRPRRWKNCWPRNIKFSLQTGSSPRSQNKGIESHKIKKQATRLRRPHVIDHRQYSAQPSFGSGPAGFSPAVPLGLDGVPPAPVGARLVRWLVGSRVFRRLPILRDPDVRAPPFGRLRALGRPGREDARAEPRPTRPGYQDHYGRTGPVPDTA